MGTFETTTTGTQDALVADFLARATYEREQALTKGLPRWVRSNHSGKAEGLELAARLLKQHTFTEEDGPSTTYKITRFYADADVESETIFRGLTLEQARRHCDRPDTQGDGWFDGYEAETIEEQNERESRPVGPYGPEEGP